MRMAAVHDQIGAVERGIEESLVAFEFQRVRHLAVRIREHAVGGHDDVAVDAMSGHPRRYSEIVCTTLETGREVTVGNFASFISASSYCGSVCTGAFGFICTTL